MAVSSALSTVAWTFLTTAMIFSVMPVRPRKLARKLITSVSRSPSALSTRLAAPAIWPAAMATIESTKAFTTATIFASFSMNTLTVS